MEQNPPAYMSGQCYTAATDRSVLSGIITEGVVNPATGSLNVRAVAGGIEVLEGSAYIAGNAVPGAPGLYYVINSSATFKPIAAPTANPRIDLVAAVVRDSTYDTSGVSQWDLVVIPGTPTAGATLTNLAGKPVGAYPNGPDDSTGHSGLLELAYVLSLPGGTTPSGLLDIRSAATVPDEAIVAKAPTKVTYTTGSHAFNKADYPGASYIKVLAVGGGGAGWGVSSSNTASNVAGAGGGSGAWAASIINLVDLPETVTVTVGVGGVCGASFTNGGDSSFGSLVVASGGKSGNLIDAVSTYKSFGMSGGSTAVGNLAHLTSIGNPGGQVINNGGTPPLHAGAGSGTMFSANADVIVYPHTSSTAGVAGRFPGGGGSGACRHSSGAGEALGGSGAPGTVVIEVY